MSGQGQHAAVLRALLGNGAGWRENAACNSAEPELFAQPSVVARRDRELATCTALTYCQGCPVRAQCTAFADAGREQGIWGGTHRRHVLQRGEHFYRVTPLLQGGPAVDLNLRKAAS